MKKRSYPFVYIYVVCLLLSSIRFIIVFGDDYIPAEDILLNCGEKSTTQDFDNRKWAPDIGSKFLLNSEHTSTTSQAASQDPSVPSVPYLSARVFRSQFTYSFHVAPGRKFVRLYFYSNSYDNLNATDALFSVSTGSFTLLKNFSISQTTEGLNYYPYIFKEYSINVDGDSLNVTFTPSSGSKNAYAFINGIEIMSMPDIYSTTDGTVMIVGQSSPYTIDNTTSLESVVRLNVGGNVISPVDDTGLYRTWYNDATYIYGVAIGATSSVDDITYPKGTPSYIAPKNVYATARIMGPNSYVNLNYNLSWYFSVDTGFNYLVRLHFCEVFRDITKRNQVVFDIFLNNEIADAGFDVVALTRGRQIAAHRDYVVLMPFGNPQEDLWLALHPNKNSKPQYYNSILNGVEVFKLSSSAGNLAGPNLIPLTKHSRIDPAPDTRSIHSKSKVFKLSSLAGNLVGPNPVPLIKQLRIDPASATRFIHSKSKKAVIARVISGGIILALISICVMVVSRRRGKGKEHSSSDGPSGWLPLSRYGNSHSTSFAKTFVITSHLLRSKRTPKTLTQYLEKQPFKTLRK